MEHLHSLPESLRRGFGFIRKEKQPESLRLVNLLNITPQEERVLKRQVRKSHGHVEVLVHPFYEEDDPDAWFPESEEYKADRDALIEQSLATGQPLVIFEEEQKLHTLLARFQKPLRGTLYLIPTVEDRSIPSHENAGMHDLLISRALDPWGTILNVLEKAGTRHVSIGGRYMIRRALTDETTDRYLHWKDHLAVNKPHAQQWLEGQFITEGCAGEAVYPFLTAFDVSLSPASSPNAIVAN